MSTKRGLFRAFLGLAAVVLLVLGIQAGQPNRPAPGAGDKEKFDKAEIAAKQKALQEKYRDFEQSLLILKQRLEKSDRKEDRDRAAQLAKVLERSGDIAVSTKFSAIVEFLNTQKLTGLNDAKRLLDQASALAKDLKEILDLLRGANDPASRREEKVRLEQLLKELEKVIREQKQVIGKIEDGRQNPKEVARDQRDVRAATRALEQKLGKLNPDDKKGQGGEAKENDNKGEAKSAKGKGEKGEGKNAGKLSETKKGEGKNEGKNAQGGQKQGADKQGQAKAGGEKDNVRKKPEEQQGQAKAGGDKKGQQGDKQAGAKSSQGGDKQSSQSKSGQSAQSKQGQSKSSQAKGGQGSPKSGDQQQQQQGDAKNDNNKKDSGDQADPTLNAKKRIQDAQDFQRQAENKVAQNKKRPALDDAERARDELEKAKKKLEDLLRQLREEELERLLTDLKRACEKMLAMQIQVYNGTKAVARAIDGNNDKKPTRANIQDSLGLSDNEKKIVIEADKAIQMLEAEGSAVAFHEVFTQVRDDMKNVQRRLGSVDVGKVTQAVEQDIIDTLNEMIKALEKAKQELKDKKDAKSGGQPPPNQDQKLLDQIAELKMIRAMQLRVNNRTRLYGREYEGEQASEPRLQGELRNLSERQERIFDVTNKIAKGDNR
jgi:hypothetical protein